VKGRIRIDVVIALAVMLALVVVDAQIGRARRAAVAETAKQVEQAENELRYLAGHGAEIGQVGRFLPRPMEGDSTGDARFLSEASDAARSFHLSITKIEPAGEQQYGSYVARLYKINFEGSYSGFAGFMRFLEGIPETVIVTGLDCSSKELNTGGRHRMTLELAVVGH